MKILEDKRFGEGQGPAQEVVYPAQFHFRVIAEAAVFVESELVSVLAGYRVTAPLAASRVSGGGRYHAYSVSVEMGSREELDVFDAALKRVSGVRMVL